MALALVLIWRATRVVNFAQVGQAMFTTFIALTVRDATGSWLLALVAAMASGLILGVIVYFLVIRPVKRLDTSGAIIATFGVLIALQAPAGMIWGGDRRRSHRRSVTPATKSSGASGLFSLRPVGCRPVARSGLDHDLVFTRTSLGLAMRASAFNPEVARLSGVRVNRMLILGWAIAGLVGAIAGVLVAPLSTISPTSFDIFLVFAFTAAVIGGLDSLVGAVAFGIGTGLVISLVSGYTDSGNAPVVALVLLVLNLLFKPEGVFGHHKARAV